MGKRRAYDGYHVKLKPSAFAKLSALQESLSQQAGRPLAKTTVIEMAMDLIGRLGLEPDALPVKTPELWTALQVKTGMEISNQRWSSMLRRKEIAPRVYDADGNPLFNTRGVSIAFCITPEDAQERLTARLEN